MLNDVPPAGQPGAVSPELDRKFRQAAFTYLHVVVLYEGATWAMYRKNMLPTRFGPPELWLLLGLVVGLLFFFLLLHWRNKWLPRALWLVSALRLPALIGGAFLAGPEARLASSFYIMAIVVIVINMIMLARAGWDL